MTGHFDRILLRSAWLAIGGVLILAALAVPLRPEAALIFPPFTEDGYYGLTIARAIAAGHGPALEGSGLTNGFQPLVVLLQAAAFAAVGGADLPALRLVAGFGWLTYVGAALLLGRVAAEATPGEAAERERRGLIATVLALMALPLWMVHFNGLETGLLLVLITVLWRLWQLGVPQRRAGLALCGALLGLTVLTRIDAGFLVVALILVETIAAWRGGPARALGRAALLAGVALLVSAPWWCFNIFLFGSPMPISGQAQQLWALDPYRWKWILWALGQTLAPWLAPTQNFDDWRSWLPLAGATALVVTALMRLPRSRLLETGSGRFASSLCLAMAALTLWYGLSSIAFWFYGRYLAPLSLVGLVWAATLLARLPMKRAALLVLVLPLLVSPTLSGTHAAWRGSITHFGTIMFWDQLQLVRAMVPDEDWVAAGQSGTLGFFRPHVLNMDGKVNREALSHAGRATGYLKAKGIRWFVDWQWYVHRALGPEPERLGWAKIAERRKFLLYRLEEPAKGSDAP
ncbi:MAG TPA: hypothetical protein VED46_15960 [Alphaproteobacteria bacterium]|nr:hypothetical protein [Alphaproteobacteria bacterium]